jgi:hypothetical protein
MITLSGTFKACKSCDLTNTALASIFKLNAETDAGL